MQSELLEPTTTTHMSEATRIHKTTHLKDLLLASCFLLALLALLLASCFLLALRALLLASCFLLALLLASCFLLALLALLSYFFALLALLLASCLRMHQNHNTLPHNHIEAIERTE